MRNLRKNKRAIADSIWGIGVLVIAAVVLFYFLGGKKLGDLFRNIGKAKAEFEVGLAEGRAHLDEVKKGLEIKH